MRRFTTILIAVIFSLLLISVSSYGADVAKLGIIDFQRVLDTSSAGKVAQALINKKGKKMKDDLNMKGEELEKIKKQYESEALVMSKEMRAEKERDFRIKVNDFKSLQQRYAKTANDLQKTHMRRIQMEIADVARKIGEKEGFLLIIEKQEGGVVYAPNTIDITDTVIKAYNVVFAEQNEKTTSE
jgi:outer membrane protein